MKFINKVMVFVMGLVVIGVVSTTIGVVTQAKVVEKSVIIDINLLDNVVTDNTYQHLYELERDEFGFVLSVKKILYNGITSNEVDDNVYYENNILYIGFISDDVEYEIYITPDNDITTYERFENNDTVEVLFEVEVKTPVIIKTLLVLIPLVLSAGLIGYLVVKKGDE